MKTTPMIAAMAMFLCATSAFSQEPSKDPPAPQQAATWIGVAIPRYGEPKIYQTAKMVGDYEASLAAKKKCQKETHVQCGADATDKIGYAVGVRCAFGEGEMQTFFMFRGSSDDSDDAPGIQWFVTLNGWKNAKCEKGVGFVSLD